MQSFRLSTRRPRPAAAARRNPTYRPAVERLEIRLALAAHTWTGASPRFFRTLSCFGVRKPTRTAME